MLTMSGSYVLSIASSILHAYMYMNTSSNSIHCGSLMSKFIQYGTHMYVLYIG